MKNPKLKKILVVLSCIPILFVGLSVPIGAVVNSTTGPAGNNELYSQSVFPFSVGFVYGDINDDGRYIMSTPVGNWGVEQNQTQNGVDEFDFANILTSNVGDTTDTGSISYEFGQRTYPEVQHYVNDANGYKYRGGYYDMSLTASVPEFVDNVTSIVFRGRDIYYNPAWNNKFFTYDVGFGPKNYLIPTFTLPELSDPTTQAFVGSYSVVAQIIDGYGKQHEVNYSISIDTRTDGLGPYMFISRDALAPYVSYSDTTNDIRSSANDTIIISEFTGYLDLQYYEYTVSSDSLDGTWVLNSDIVRTLGSPDFSMMSSAVNTTNISGSMNIYNKTSGSFISAPIESLLITSLENFNNTTANRVVFRLSSYVSSRPYYNFELFFRTGVGHYFNNVVWPLSGDGVLSCLYSGANWSDDSEYDSVFSIDSDNGILIRTFSIIDDGLSTDEYNLILSWLQANATKQASASTLAEEGTWEPATNTALASQINVSVPIYDSSQSSSVTPGSTDWNLWSLPIASKYIKTTDLFQVINESLAKDYTSWLATATGGFLDAQIFPGFTIGGVMGTLIAFSVVMLFLKLFAGG